MKLRLLIALAVVALAASGPLYAQVDVPDATPSPTDVLPALPSFDPALQSNGATVTVDSKYPGYNGNVINNGVYNDKHDLSYAKLGWASAERKKDHWIEIDFAKESTISKVTVFWCWDNGSYHSSAHFQIQVPNAAGDGWDTVKEVTDGPSAIQLTNVVLDKPITASKIRYFQPANGGDTRRPALAWIKAVVVYP